MVKCLLQQTLTTLLFTCLGSAFATPGFSAPTNQCFIYTFSESGFGSNLAGLLMAVAAWGDPLHNNTIYVNEKEWGYKCAQSGSWNTFFQGQMPRQLPGGVITPELETSCVIIDYNASFDAFVSLAEHHHTSFTVRDAFQLLGKAARQLWKLSDRMTSMADRQWKHYDMLSKPIAGVHIRAGDKSIEDHEHSNWHNRHEWAANFKRVASQHSGDVVRTCLLFGDQWPAMWNATRVMHAQGISTNLHMIGGDQESHIQDRFNEETEQRRCDTTTAMLMEADALARSDVFIGSMNSNLPRLVFLLRTHVYRKHMNTTGDASGVYAWHYDYRQTEGGSSARFP